MTSPVARFEHDDRAALVAERVLGDQLGVGAQAEHDVAGVLLAEQQVAEVAEAQRRRVAAR